MNKWVFVLIFIAVALAFLYFYEPKIISLAIESLGSIKISGQESLVNIVGGETGLRSLTENPEKYMGKTVTIKGVLTFTGIEYLGGASLSDAGIDYQILDKDDYKIYLKSFKEPSRIINYGTEYKITGIWRYVDFCNCEYRYRDASGNCSYIIKLCYTGLVVDCNRAPEPKYLSGEIVNKATNASIKGDFSVEDFSTNLPLSVIAWRAVEWSGDSIGIREPASTCPTENISFSCSYNLVPIHIANPEKGIFATVVKEYERSQKIEGETVKEYRCVDNKGVYFLEGTEPMVKI